jgi:peptidoglycan/xylan/chitin deacetylase (PgdA/CDA1 family)
MYHDVPADHPAGDVPPMAAIYHLPRSAFHSHLDAIRASGLPAVTASQSLDADYDHVVITFDDGWEGSLTHGVESLVAAGMRATYFVTRDLVRREGFASPDQLRAAVAAGMELGTHGVSHRRLAQQPESVVRSELADSKAFLEDLLGAPVRTGSVPGGDWSPVVARVARETGYRVLATSRPGVNRAGDDPFRRSRVAVRATTDATTIARWLRFSLVPERMRYLALEIPRRLLGVERFGRLRRRLLGGSAARDLFSAGAAAGDGRAELRPGAKLDGDLPEPGSRADSLGLPR